MCLASRPIRFRLFLVAIVLASSCPGIEFHVSPRGRDDSPGTAARPFATLERARREVRAVKERATGPIRVYLHGGVYYRTEPFVLTAEDSGTGPAPVIYEAYGPGRPVISGARRLSLTWSRYGRGIYQARVPREQIGEGFSFDRLYVDGEFMPLARYPNFPGDHRLISPGCAEDAISPERVRRWKNPAGGLLHGLYRFRWGSIHQRITGADRETGLLRLAGGGQINRVDQGDPMGPCRMVEGIFEELDAPGEWYFDRVRRVLYFLPPPNVRLEKARMEAAGLARLIVLRGSGRRPVRHVHFQGLTIRHTRRTLLDPYEPLLRGDWSIARTAAVYIEGAEDCSVRDSRFEELGGNGVFLSGYNRRVEITGCRFVNLGSSAICFVGETSAVRSPSIEYHNELPYGKIDRRPGPKTPDYPARCRADDNLIHHIGLADKQTAGVFISMSEEITVGHNTIYHVPRAGICINDGCWGGHVIEHNDVFDTVRETGDHGPFNSWGRDRWWPGSHTHGIDLDDGSTNYHIYKNLCLGMGWKTREGFFRRVENNIAVSPYYVRKNICVRGNEDVIKRNIVVITQGVSVIGGSKFLPAEMKSIDYNLYYAGGREPEVVVARQGVDTPPAPGETTIPFSQFQAEGYDVHSVVADPLFVDPAAGDYRVRPDSPALALGFENFPMDGFGVLKPEFKAEAAAAFERYDRRRRQAQGW